MKAAQVLYGYAGVLIFCGVLAFSIAAVGGNMQITPLIPVVMGAIMIICGVMANMYHRNHTIGMIGIHAGLVLPLLYGLMFARLAYARFTADEPTIYLVTIFMVMLIASIIALVMLIALRPKPADRT